MHALADVEKGGASLAESSGTFIKSSSCPIIHPSLEPRELSLSYNQDTHPQTQRKEINDECFDKKKYDKPNVILRDDGRREGREKNVNNHVDCSKSVPRTTESDVDLSVKGFSRAEFYRAEDANIVYG